MEAEGKPWTRQLVRKIQSLILDKCYHQIWCHLELFYPIWGNDEEQRGCRHDEDKEELPAWWERVHFHTALLQSCPSRVEESSYS